MTRPLSGRSTAWWRVIPALLSPPFVAAGAYLASVSAWEIAKGFLGHSRGSLVLDPASLMMFVIMALIFIGPMTLIAGLVWIPMHRNGATGPVHAALLGAVLAGLGFVAMRVWLVGENLAAPWAVWLVGVGAMAGLVVWTLAYLGRGPRAVVLQTVNAVSEV